MPGVAVSATGRCRIVAGAIFGAVLGAVGHGVQGGRRDFASVSGLQAERYEVQVDDEVAAEAERLLRELPAGRR
jgi:hypothetical protein